jgi:hypothetical protein
MARRTKSRSPLSRRRCLALLAALAYLAGAVGLPLPVLGRGGDEGTRRAAVRPCGCPVEERQARTCCCCAPAGAGGCCGRPAGNEEQADADDLTWVPVLSAWRCGGLQALPGGSAISLRPPALLAWAPEAHPLAWLAHGGEVPLPLPLPLPDPPPRSFLGRA